MTNALMTTSVEFEVNGEAVKLSGNTVKQYLVRGNGSVSDQELVMFMNLCKFQKLNPFLNEAYLIKFGTSPAQIIVSKEAFMKRAENHPKYEGMEAGIIVERDGELVDIEGAVKLTSDILIGGYAKVYRSDKKLSVVRISLAEFGKGQATWKDMPMNMIRKSAIVNAQREAFPETLGALYTDEEIQDVPRRETNSVEQEIKQNANSEVLDIDETTGEINPIRKEVNKAQEEILEQKPIAANEPGF